MRVTSLLEHSRLLRFAVLSGIAVALRILSFFRTVIDHDESTYLVIADAVRQGAIYWVDAIDVKPPGIFWLYALLQTLFGKAIFTMRLFAALFIALTSFFLFETKRKLGSGFRAAWASALIYLFLNSLFTFYGVSPNTETFFGTFVAAAFWLALAFPGYIGYFASGLLLGFGFLIKPVVCFDGLALGVFLLWDTPQSIRKISALAFLALGFLLPFAGAYAHYRAMGHADTFLFYAFEASSRYPVSAGWEEYLISAVDTLLRFLPVTYFFYVALRHPQTPASTRRLAWIWGLSVLIPIYLPGKFFGHYFIQLFLPLSMLAGEFFALPRPLKPAFIGALLRPKTAYTLLGLLVLANWFLQKKDYIDRPDAPARVARELQATLKPEETLYIANYHPILYYLLDKKSPTPYIHRGLIWTPAHRYALQIDLEQEIDRIIAAGPHAVVVQDSTDSPRLNRFLERNYRRTPLGETERGARLYLYRRSKAPQD
jgi:4-amino-4-deoxy-L-arabinose transferase-like glycosyltransferase